MTQKLYTSAKWGTRKGELILRVKQRGRWKTIEPGIQPYFFIRDSDFERFMTMIDRDKKLSKMTWLYERNFRSIFNEKLIKIIVETPDKVGMLNRLCEARNIATYEANIPFTTRWMIDTDATYDPSPTVAYFDIEVDFRGGFPDLEKADKQIMSIGAVDHRGREIFISETDEEELLTQFLERIAFKYDVLVGYNSSNFDMPYLEKRLAKYGYKVSRNDIQHLDMLDMYKSIVYVANRGGGLSLDEVAERELGEGKYMKLTREDAETLWRDFQNEKKLLRKYNMRDAEILYQLDMKYGLTRIFALQSYISKTPYIDAFQTRRIVDGVVLSYLRQKHGDQYPKLPTKSIDEERTGETTGGFVMKPQPGIFEDVLYADLSSYYPTLIMTFNIGVDTLDEEGDIYTAHKRFTSSRRSIMAETLEKLYYMRRQAKQKMKKADEDKRKYYDALQITLKRIMNSTYGVHMLRGYRFYHIDIAESVTRTGRHLIQKLADWSRELGLKPLYADTDSVFIQLEGRDPSEVVDILNQRLRQYVLVTMNVPENYYMLKLDINSHFMKIVFGDAKKRYAGITVDGEKIVVGHDLIRRDTPELLRRFQSRIIDMMFTHKSFEQLLDDISSKLANIKTALYSGMLDELLVMKKSLGKELVSYEVDQPHIRAARKLMEMGRYTYGMEIEYVVTDFNGKAVVEPVVDGRIPSITSRGYKYYYNRLLKLVKRTVNIDRDPRQASIERWIK